MGRKISVDAVIFDCDGVLIDSEIIYNQVLAGMVTELGCPMTTEQCIARFMGKPMALCAREIEMLTGRDLPGDFEKQYINRSFALFESRLRPVDGVPELLSVLTLPSAIASSSGHRELEFTLGLAGLHDYFAGRIYSAEDVERGKPEPDLYLHAARERGFDPGSCLVIEDSLPGVKAGVAAGMTVLGYAGLSDARALNDAGAAAVFRSMFELPNLVAL